ncbi:unnamed protein product [Paramecium primaurelia]|uniref:Uncharacterized protein n=1 Tax=Paramecium primaurelia TaxID=5886 RepID=A0A8S1K557_PARPR|nr:unnamed protein product [Paramecium primaurelia]
MINHFIQILNLEVGMKYLSWILDKMQKKCVNKLKIYNKKNSRALHFSSLIQFRILKIKVFLVD